MMKVLIADDEPMFRIGLKHCIDWSEYGFGIVLEASDGRQALEMVEEHRPDVIFTDIKMPVMDGLELTRNIVNMDKSIKIIILSCYNDFEYVREAMKLGACDYILKLSLKPDDVVELLKKLKTDIEEEKAYRVRTELLNRELHQTRDKLLEEFFRGILFEKKNISPEEYALKADILKLGVGYDRIFSASISIDDYPGTVKKLGDWKLVKLILLNISTEIFTGYLPGETVWLDKGNFLWVGNCSTENDGQDEGKIAGCIHKINLNLKKYFDFTISAGICVTPGNIGMLESMYSEAASALTDRFFKGYGFIGFYRPGNGVAPESVRLDVEDERKIYEAMELLKPEQANEVIEKIAARLNTEGIPPDTARKIFKEVVFVINRVIRVKEGDMSCFTDENPFEAIDRLETLADVVQWFKDFTLSAADYISNQENFRYRKEIGEAIRHVRENIGRNVSLKEAADIAHMNVKYFCQVFKKETGENYLEYVTGVKMELARELLKNPGLKTYEVALRLGFEDEGYFGKIFKKYTGMNPKSYRERYKP